MRSEQEKLNGLFIQTCKKQNPSLLDLRSLLRDGANVNARDSHRKTGLMWACVKGYDSIIPYLLTMGAIVNTSDDAGNTPLMMACMSDNPHIIRMLLYGGAHVNASRPQNSGTALMVACLKNNVDVVKVLLGAGADIDANDSRGRNVFSFYAKKRPDILKLLYTKKYNTMSPTNKNIRNRGARVILKAFKQKQLNEKLLEECNELSPDIAHIRELLKKKANVNVRDWNRNTPLITACSWGNLELTKLLIQYGAMINVWNRDRETPMIFACQSKNSLELVKFMIHYGANVNVRDTDGSTPLMYACAKDNIEVAKILIQHGARIFSKTKDGKNALQFSKGNTRKYIEKLFIEEKYKTMGSGRLGIRNMVTRLIQKAFRERLQPRLRRKKAVLTIQRYVRQLPRIKAAKTIQSVVRRHYATNRNSQLSKNAITLERIPRRNAVALNGRMYHRESIRSLYVQGNPRVPHSRRRIILNDEYNGNGRYTTLTNSNTNSSTNRSSQSNGSTNSNLVRTRSTPSNSNTN